MNPIQLDIPPIDSCEDAAVDLVVSVINRAQTKVGIRQNLFQLANSYKVFGKAIVDLNSLTTPIGYNSELLIRNTIERKWELSDMFAYNIKHMGISHDETSTFHYLEVQFSQPTCKYPIPQATVMVYFRVQNEHMEPDETKKLPMVVFRLEGHSVDHDIRYVKLVPDWILAIMKMKILVNKRLHSLQFF